MNREKVLTAAVDLLAAHTNVSLWEIADECEEGGRVDALLRAAGLPEEAVQAYGWGSSLGQFVLEVIKESHEKSN
jgi:hypothetical protein